MKSVACLCFLLPSISHAFSMNGVELHQRSKAILQAEYDRRGFIASAVGTAAAAAISPAAAKAAIGTLPELADTNVVVQGVTVQVADKSQQDAMIEFLENAFDFVVLRRTSDGAVTNTWLGFGPEQMSIPSSFELPVSSFANYGGHASICVQYNSLSKDVYYRTGENAPGDNVAYLQIGVPTYRVSQMVKAGGNVIDAYGFVNVVSPSGLPMRSIVGIAPDPIMFIALNCQDLEASKEFYQQLGFSEQEYPFCRPSKGTGQFEPPQPPKSVYMAPSPNSMGVLLVQTSNRKKKVSTNPAFQGLNLVYAPSGEDPGTMSLTDPSNVGINLQSYTLFESQEKATRVPAGAK